MYIANEHIQHWIASGKAITVSSKIARELGGYLNELPWGIGGGLNWSLLHGRCFDLEVLRCNPPPPAFIRIALSADPYWIFWYSPDQPCIACVADFAKSRIDEAFWGAPGKRFVFGASVQTERICPIKSHFAEYDGLGSLTGVTKSPGC